MAAGRHCLASARRLAVLIAIGLGGAACTSKDVDYSYPDLLPGAGTNTYGTQPGIFGSDGLVLFGGGRQNQDNGGGGIGVNSFLWRASLDAISFMPLSSADPFGGVIITDWYPPPEAPNERFKLNIIIIGRQLRADALKVSAFRQHRDGSGQWVDAAVDPKTAIDLENAILTRARQIRIDTAAR
jgi:hypothetical protein